MGNEETNKLTLVERITASSKLFRGGSTIYAAKGFSKEVFRNGGFIASVRTSEDQNQLSSDKNASQSELWVRAGDTILIVNLGPRTIILAGPFYTSDGYSPSYEVQLEIRVDNPPLFAERYLQESDPVGLLQSAIIQEFNDYAARTDHERLSPTKLRYDALSNVQSRYVGMRVVKIYKSPIFSDPKYARVREIERAAAEKKIEMDTQAELNSLEYKHQSIMDEQRKKDELALKGHEKTFEREQHQKDKAVEREETQIDQEAAAMNAVTQEMTQKIATHIMIEMDKDLDSGMTIEELLNKNPIAQRLAQRLLGGSIGTPELPSPARENGPDARIPTSKIKEAKTSFPRSSDSQSTKETEDIPVGEPTTGEFRELDQENW